MTASPRKDSKPLSVAGQGLSFSGMLIAADARHAQERPLIFAAGAVNIELDGLVALPGLVNAHDHLEFALFPRLGGKRYRNALEWAEDIHRPDESPVREHLRIPKADRLVWGGLRNLLGGVTTVCHHNPWEPAVFDAGFPVRVVREMGWAHSLRFENDVARRFRETPADRPFVIHAAEGSDEPARAEIHTLDSMGVLSDRTVIVHGTACGDEEWDLLERRGCGVVWCPSSNRFLFGKTLSNELLRSGPPVALGTDSPLTADGGMFDELACAVANGVPPDGLYAMATETPAKLLRLPPRPDDWILLRDRGLAPCETLLDGPELEAVLVGGEPNLVSERLARAYPLLAEGLEPLLYGNRVYWVRARVSDLLAGARKALGSDVRLGGKPVSEAAR